MRFQGAVFQCGRFAAKCPVFIHILYLHFYYVVQTQMYSMIYTHCQRGILPAPTDRLHTPGQCITMVLELCPSVPIRQFVHSGSSHLWPSQMTYLMWTWILKMQKGDHECPLYGSCSSLISPFAKPSLVWTPQDHYLTAYLACHQSVGSDKDHRAEGSIWAESFQNLYFFTMI